MAKKESVKGPKVVTEAMDFYELCQDAYGDQRLREREDLEFQIPDVNHQWDEYSRNARSAQTVAGVSIPPRPMLCVSTLDEPIQLVLNQERAAHLGITIHPLNEEASDDTAQVLQGLYRHIEVSSRAHLARSWAYDRAVKAGTGVYRILTEYDPTTGVAGDQRIVIKRVLFQDAVFFDPFAQEPDYSDGTRALVIERMPIEKYKKEFPNSKVADFGDKDFAKYADTFPGWFDSTTDARTVQVAESYWVETESRDIEVEDWKGNLVRVPDPTAPRTVYYAKINGYEELEPKRRIPGIYIPLVPVLGKELQPVNGERHFIGMIRPAKDGARLTNYAASQAVTLSAYEPQSPWIMEEGQDEGYKELWEKANTVPVPALKYKRIGLSGIPGEKPSRVPIDVSRLGPSMQLLSMGRDFVQSATATYDPALGKQTSAHRSGRALVALQDQTTEGTSNYLDNLAQVSMPHEARIVIHQMPEVYDRPGRVATILDENDQPSHVMLNAPYAPNAQTKRPEAMMPGAQTDANVANPEHPAKFYNLAKGRYGVSVTIAKSSTSRLQEGADSIGAIIESAPEMMMPLIGPEWIKFRDFPGKNQLEKILRRNRDHMFPWLSDAKDAEMPQQLQQAQQQIALLTQQLQQTAELADKNKTQLEVTRIKEASENERAEKDRELKLAIAELSALAKELQETRALFMEERARLGTQQHDANEAMEDRAHDVGLAAQGHAQTLEAADQAHAQNVEAGQIDHGNTLEQGAQAAALAPQPNEASV